MEVGERRRGGERERKGEGFQHGGGFGMKFWELEGSCEF